LFIFPIAGVLHIYYGIEKQTGFFAPGYGLADISGQFNNSGIFGGFIGCIVIITLGLKYYINDSVFQCSNKRCMKFLRIIISCGLIVFIVQLLASNSRTAWLACLVGIIYLVKKKHCLWNKFIGLKRLKRVTFLLVLFGVTFIFFLGLYRFKKDSADGRILIWNVSANMIADSPLFGHGINGFPANYMNYQASYFCNEGSTNYKNLADDNHFAFNEFVRIFVENGAMGLLFVVLLVLVLFKTKSVNPQPDIVYLLKALLLFLITFSMFSYPFEFFQFKVILCFLLALLSSVTTEKLYFNRNALSGRVVLIVHFVLLFLPGLYVSRQAHLYSVGYRK
jgi:O-antigen ligase